MTREREPEPRRRRVGRIATVLGLAGGAILLMWGVHASLGSGPTGAQAGQHAAAATRPPLSGAMKGFVLHEAPAPAPAIAFTDRIQQPLSLETFKGKLVLLNFWATWCAPCVREMPSLERLQGALGGAAFQVVAVSQDRPGLPLVEKFYDEQKLKQLDIYVDKTGQSGRAFKLRGLPTTLLIDAEGREIGRLEGAADWSGPDAVALIRHYLPAASPPATKATALPERPAG